MSTHNKPNWIDYDSFQSGKLDPEKWMPFQMPTADGLIERVDPSSIVEVHDNAIRVSIEAFTAQAGNHQGLDNTKYMVFSAGDFHLPEDRPARFAVDMAAENNGGNPHDYRYGAVAFLLTDLEHHTFMVFNLFATSKRAFAVFERLAAPGVETPFTRVVEDPFVPLGDDFHTRHTYEVLLDRGLRQARYYVDGHLLHEERDIEPFPPGVHVGFGLLTTVAIADGRSQSNVGQGMNGTWSNFRYTL